MNWEEIKKDTSKIYPKRKVCTSRLTSLVNGQIQKSLCWVNIAYANYDYRKFCKFCIELQIELRENDRKIVDLDEYELQVELEKFASDKFDFDDIETYFSDRFSGICIALILSIRTTEEGLEINIYVDDPEEAANRCNELKSDADRMFDFDFQITEDENWDIIGMLLY